MQQPVSITSAINKAIVQIKNLLFIITAFFLLDRASVPYQGKTVKYLKIGQGTVYVRVHANRPLVPLSYVISLERNFCMWSLPGETERLS